MLAKLKNTFMYVCLATVSIPVTQHCDFDDVTSRVTVLEIIPPNVH